MINISPTYIFTRVNMLEECNLIGFHSNKCKINLQHPASSSASFYAARLAGTINYSNIMNYPFMIYILNFH
jgi:hypothetical protein